MEIKTITTKKATKENVENACQQLRSEGRKVTVLSVTAFIGGGSPNDVGELVRGWKKAHPEPKPEEITLDPSIAKMIARQIAACAAVATQTAEARASEADEDVRTLSMQGQILEHRIAQLEAELNESRAQVQQLTGELSERAQQFEVLRRETRTAMKASEGTAENERAAAEGLRQELIRAQIRIETLLGFEKALLDAQEEVRQASDNLAQTRQSAAVARAQAVAAVERAEQAEAREAGARAEAAQLRDEVARGHASAQELARTLAKVNADLAASLERREPVQEAAENIIAGLQDRGKRGTESRSNQT